MTHDLVARGLELRRARAAYVHARVVVAEKPTSAKPGAEAIVLADGTLEGFVGGACAESTVRAQALALLDSGDTLLLRITPEPEEPRPGSLTVHNPCLSGGTLEIFLEPIIPAPLVVVAGDTPIARALLELVGPLGHAGSMYDGTLPAMLPPSSSPPTVGTRSEFWSRRCRQTFPMLVLSPAGSEARRSSAPSTCAPR